MRRGQSQVRGRNSVRKQQFNTTLFKLMLGQAIVSVRSKLQLARLGHVLYCTVRCPGATGVGSPGDGV